MPAIKLGIAWPDRALDRCRVAYEAGYLSYNEYARLFVAATNPGTFNEAGR